MIPVRGMEGARVGILGLGRSGLSAAAALREGGAEALCWDDSPEGRAKAEAAGHTVLDLTRRDGVEVLDRLIVSPGIPHLYPEPHKVIRLAMEMGVPVDNDIGLFFRSLAGPEWYDYDRPPRVVAVTGSNGKSTTSALIHHCLEVAGRESQLAGNIGAACWTSTRRATAAWWCWSCRATRPTWRAR